MLLTLRAHSTHLPSCWCVHSYTTELMSVQEIVEALRKMVRVTHAGRRAEWPCE